MDRDAFPTRDITYDLFTTERIAAAGARDHQIVYTSDDDRVISQTD